MGAVFLVIANIIYTQIIDKYPDSISIIANIDPIRSDSVIEVFLNDFDGEPLRLPVIQNKKNEYVFKLPKKYIKRVRIDPADSITRNTLIYSITFNFKNNDKKNYDINKLIQWKSVNSKIVSDNGVIKINSTEDDHYIYGEDQELTQKNNTHLRIPYIDKFEPLEWVVILISALCVITILLSSLKIGILLIIFNVISIGISNILLKNINIIGPESLNTGKTIGRAAFIGESYINKSVSILIPFIIIIIIGLLYIFKVKKNEE